MVGIATEGAAMLKGGAGGVTTASAVATKVEGDTQGDIVFTRDEGGSRSFTECWHVVRELGRLALLEAVTGTGTDEATRDAVPTRGAKVKGPRRGGAIIRLGGVGGGTS